MRERVARAERQGGVGWTGAKTDQTEARGRRRKEGPSPESIGRRRTHSKSSVRRTPLRHAAQCDAAESEGAEAEAEGERQGSNESAGDSRGEEWSQNRSQTKEKGDTQSGLNAARKQLLCCYADPVDDDDAAAAAAAGGAIGGQNFASAACSALMLTGLVSTELAPAMRNAFTSYTTATRQRQQMAAETRKGEDDMRIAMRG